VEPANAATLTAALKAGKPVDVDVSGIAADSLGARRIGEIVFPIAQATVAGTVLVDDEAIMRAQLELWDSARLVAEPGGATAFAAVIMGAYKPEPGERVGVVISGANTSAVSFGALKLTG
jgi:threonine dehydratase